MIDKINENLQNKLVENILQKLLKYYTRLVKILKKCIQNNRNII